MSKTVAIIVVVVVAIIAFVVTNYNRLIRMIEEVNNNKHQIDIQLDRRFKVFESLINVVNKYMNYEQTTLKDVVALRNQATQAVGSGDEKARMAAENQISQIARGINVVFEQYPDLKANQNAMQLQEEIVNTENKLTFSKQAYNDSIERYNAQKKSFFQSFIVKMFAGSLDKTFEYWQLDDKTIAEQEKYTVKL
ncbi:MAG: LemA family protein [Legionellales bacterium]|nr:LemA family protein [Legionellales bacterium]